MLHCSLKKIKCVRLPEFFIRKSFFASADVLSSKSYYQSEQALSSVTQKLQDESNEVKYLDILTSGSVPEDCNCLVITTLKEELIVPIVFVGVN